MLRIPTSISFAVVVGNGPSNMPINAARLVIGNMTVVPRMPRPGGGLNPLGGSFQHTVTGRSEVMKSSSPSTSLHVRLESISAMAGVAWTRGARREFWSRVIV
jgi:hypothetical protein